MFYGNIPRRLSRDSYLQLLDLADNNLTGSIPTGFGNMTSMMHQNKEQFITSVDKSAAYPYFIRIHVNWKGHDDIFQREVALVTGIDLSTNFLSGEIPTELSNLQVLKFLNLSRNHLSGGIPKDIGNLTFLESLDLSVNQLSGPIPSSITNLMSLSSLNLSSNNLSGEIPKGNQLQTLDDPSIYGNNSGLCGFPLSIKCPNNSSSVSAFNKQKEYHKDLEDLWLCYWVVAGFIFGLWVWLGGLIFFKSWRMAIFGYMDRLKNIVM
jgi:Leucine-rich repeat (LRR) protein